MKYSKTLPRDTEEMVLRIREYLQTSDLSGLTQQDLATLLNAPITTIQHRLSTVGTTWQKLKMEEKTRRLELIIARPGKVDTLGAAEALGYAEEGSFFFFFKTTRGETFTDWRMRRQVA